MRDRCILVLYAAAVVAATTLHSLPLLAGMLAGAVLLAGHRRGRIARRALLAVALFTSMVLIAYTVSALLTARSLAGWQVLGKKYALLSLPSFETQ